LVVVSGADPNDNEMEFLMMEAALSTVRNLIKPLRELVSGLQFTNAMNKVEKL